MMYPYIPEQYKPDPITIPEAFKEGDAYLAIHFDAYCKEFGFTEQ